MKKLLIILLVLTSFNALAECKSEGHQLTIVEDYLWLLKGRQETTPEEYQQAYNVYTLVKAEYDKCVTKENIKIEG